MRLLLLECRQKSDKGKRCVGWAVLLFCNERWDKTGVAIERKEPGRRCNYKFARERGFIHWKACTPVECLQLAVNYQQLLFDHLSVNTASPLLLDHTVATEWSNSTCTEPHTYFSVLSDLSRSDSLTGVDVGLTHTMLQTKKRCRRQGGRVVGVRPASSPVNWPSL